MVDGGDVPKEWSRRWSDLLGRQPASRRSASARLLIGSLIDFRAGRHAWGDLLFENNCSIRGFIQAPAGYLRHYDCPIRICRDPWLWSVGVKPESRRNTLIIREKTGCRWVRARRRRGLDKVRTDKSLHCIAAFRDGGERATWWWIATRWKDGWKNFFSEAEATEPASPWVNNPAQYPQHNTIQNLLCDLLWHQVWLELWFLFEQSKDGPEPAAVEGLTSL